MATDNIIEIIVRAKDEATATLKKAEKAASGLGDKFGGALKIGAEGAAVGIAAMVAALGKCAYEAGQEEQGIARLVVALKNQGINYDVVKVKLEDVIDTTMQKTGIADDKQRESIGTLVTVTGDLDKALELNRLAMDLSIAKQIDLTSAAEIVGKVSQGNTSILTRYGIVVGEDATATEALTKMTQMFGGQAEAMGQTSAGAFKIIQNRMNDMMETVGVAVLPLLNRVFKIVGDILDRIDLEKITSSLGKVLDALMPLIDSATRLLGDIIVPLSNTILPALVLVLAPLIAGLGSILDWLEKTVGSGGTLLVLSATLLAVSGTMRTLTFTAIPGLIMIISGALTSALTLLCAHPVFAAIAAAVIGITLIARYANSGGTPSNIGGGTPDNPSLPSNLGTLQGMSGGGVISELTALYGIRSQRFYGVAGEVGLEYVTPSAGVTLVNNIYLDGELIAENVINRVSRIARQQGA